MNVHETLESSNLGNSGKSDIFRETRERVLSLPIPQEGLPDEYFVSLILFFFQVSKMPTERYEINLQKSRVQPLIRPSLSPVSRKLCQNSQVVLLEPKTFGKSSNSLVDCEFHHFIEKLLE